MPFPIEMEYKIAKYLGVEDPDDDPQLVWDVLYDKINNDHASWASIYRFFFEDYQQERHNRFFDESVVEFFFNFDEIGFYNLIKKVMRRDNLSPVDLPDLCAVVGEEFERFHQRFYIEAKQLKDGTIKENDYSPSSYQGWKLSDYDEPLKYHLLMIELLQLWQYFTQILQWRKRTKGVFRLLEDTFKSLSYDYQALAPFGYELWKEHLDEFDPYRLIDRISLDGNFRIIKLNLNDYNVHDLSPLSSLTELRVLTLYNENYVTDLSPLSNLYQLEILVIESNIRKTDCSSSSLGDLHPLVGLVNLVELKVNNFFVVDLSPLINLSKMEILSLDYNPISDFQPLSQLIILRQLSLAKTGLSDLSFLKHLTQLNYLNLSQNPLSDLSPIAFLDNLEKLNLFNYELISLNISPLVHLQNLADISTSCDTHFLCDKKLIDSITCPALLKVKDKIQFV